MAIRNKVFKDAAQPTPLTRLAGKHHSPLIVRKYTRWGPPIYVALITDDNLNGLDDKVVEFMTNRLSVGDGTDDWQWPPGIQDLRNVAGELTEYLFKGYDKVEGAAVILYADKMFISSLHGDFMIHDACRIELFGLLTMSTGV